MVWVILLLLLGLICTLLFILAQSLPTIFHDIRSVLKRTKDKKSEALEAYIQNEFPVGKECVFVGQYISHWEMGGFNWVLDEQSLREWNVTIMCELDILFDGGWDWLKEGLGYPATREDLSGKFDLAFRGKIIERGFFGHMGLCSHRIEVIEILSVKKLTA
jgi:hypothetical protein